MTQVRVAFGSNLGDREGQIKRALSLLGEHVALTAVSSLYQTAPMYVTEQPPFLNGVAAGTTELGPIGLVALLKQIEREVGRLPRIANGPREIDLDLLTYGSIRLSSEAALIVSVPHPRMTERRFVVEPLVEIDPDPAWPSVLAQLSDQDCVRVGRLDIEPGHVRVSAEPTSQ